MLWKGKKNQEDNEEEAVTKKAIKELEIFVSQIFYNFFQFISFFQSLYFIIFLLYFFLSTTFTHTHKHDPHPRPTTFSYTLKLTTFLAPYEHVWSRAV